MTLPGTTRISNQTRDKTLTIAMPRKMETETIRRDLDSVFQMNPPNVNTGTNQRVCFECGAQRHFKRDCPKLKNNNNRGNRVGNAKDQEKVYAMGNAGTNPDNNVVTVLTGSTGFLFVKKKDGYYPYVAIDYRELKQTDREVNSYPLPRIDDLNLHCNVD
ncbi:putative reverse transcriptase domain-containing protein [Tanacetum coccineum]